MSKLSGAVLVFLILHLSLIANESSESDLLDYWIELVRESAGVTDILDNVGDRPWPKLSVKEDEGRVTKEQLLASLMANYLVEHDRANRERGSESAVRNYAKWTVDLVEAGGYYNLLLADSFKRMFIGHMLYSAFGDSEVSVNLEAANLLEGNSLFSAFGKVISQETGRRVDSFGELIRTAGRSRHEIENDYFFNNQKYSNVALLREPDFVRLGFRVLVTDMLFEAHLRASLEFFALGGKGVDINLEDTRQFDLVFPHIGRFAFPEFSFRMEVAHLYALKIAFGDRKMYERDVLTMPVFYRVESN